MSSSDRTVIGNVPGPADGLSEEWVEAVMRIFKDMARPVSVEMPASPGAPMSACARQPAKPGAGSARWVIERRAGSEPGRRWREVVAHDSATLAITEFAALRVMVRGVSPDHRASVFGSAACQFRLARYGVISGTLIEERECFTIGLEPVDEGLMAVSWGRRLEELAGRVVGGRGSEGRGIEGSGEEGSRRRQAHPLPTPTPLSGRG